MYDSWYRLLRDLYRFGETRSPRGMETRELLGVQLVVQDGLDNVLSHPDRGLNYRFMVAEWLWILSGSDRLAPIARFNGKISEFSDDGVVLSGAYGPRIMSQIPWVLEKLNDSDTRQAVITIWSPTPKSSKDIPCTVYLQFFRRTDTIHLIVGMRSSDIWLGLPYDFFVFSQLLNCVCGELNCRVGFVQFNLGSSHLYERDAERAKTVLDRRGLGESRDSPALPGFPPTELLMAVANADILKMHQFESPWNMYARILHGTVKEAYEVIHAAQP